MTVRIPCAALLAILLISANLSAAPASRPALSEEEFHYSWRLRGGLAWVAGLKFPTSGIGELKNLPRTHGESFESQLLITAPDNRNGYYVYRSEIDPVGSKTLVSFYGYGWGRKHRNERTLFDYVKRLARIRKVTPDKVENRVKPITSQNMRDILTGIHYLRANADKIQAPVRSEIYSEGKTYPVLFRTLGAGTYELQGKKIATRGFLITASPGEKKWPGGIKVWLSTDERSLPVRIEIQRNLASVQLDLKSFSQ